MSSRIRSHMKRKIPIVTNAEEGQKLQPFARLESFRHRHKLSVRNLAVIAGGSGNGASSSQILRLLQGEVTQETYDELTPKLRAGLRQYLLDQGKEATLVERELAGVFTNDSESFSLTLHQQAEMPAWSQRLDAFRLHYSLSYNKLVQICGGPDNGVCATSLHRRAGDLSIEPRSSRRIKPLIIAGLRRFLAARGRTHEQIETELSHIFPHEEVAMIAPRTTLPPEAVNHFGLKRDPFSITSDPRNPQEAFTCTPLDRVAHRIEDAINYQGFLALIGDIGSGKTMMKARIMDKAARSNGKMRLIWPKFAEMERVNAGGIVAIILEAFEQSPSVRLVTSQRRLEKMLEHLHDQSIRVALCFDEAHHLNETVFSALKNFYELGTGGYDRYVSIILFGQPKLKGRLQDYRFREIAERLEVIEMPDMDKHAFDYVTHRMKLAGVEAERIIERAAIKRLSAQASTPLALGNLVNGALIKAYELNERRVVAAMIKTTQDEPGVRSMRRAG